MKFILSVLKLGIFVSIFFFSSSFSKLYVANNQDTSKVVPKFRTLKNKWIDSVFNSLSLDEKIGQLIVVAVYPTAGESHHKSIDNVIKKYKPGALMFSKGAPIEQANLTNRYQSISKTPLLISIDGEWGLSMRLDSVVKYPRQMLLGAIQNDKLIYDFGQEVGRQCKQLGIHINFAPVIDINNNPLNPVIGSRSFGEQRWNVAHKGFAYMFGMQQQHIITTAKHFPGHGDTNSDSHYTLPVINHPFQRLDSIELYPFKYLINNGLTGMMVAHLFVPALDSTKNMVSSLSPRIVGELLREKLNFQGLIFTDALGMKATNVFGSQAEVAVQAFRAGADMLLMPRDIPGLISGIKAAIKRGEISKKEIDRRCYKILQAKSWVGLSKYKPIDTKSLHKQLNLPQAVAIKRKLIENAITLVENKDFIIPFKNIDKVKIASVSIGNGKKSQFQKTLSLYDDIKHFYINKKASVDEFNSLMEKLLSYDVVVLAFHSYSHRPEWYGLTPQSIKFAHQLTNYTKVVVDIFANPYILSRFNRKKFYGIVMSYEDSRICQDLSAQLLFGGISAAGRLPVSAGKQYPVRTGLIQEKIRLKYATPLEVEINEFKLNRIDSIVGDAINKRAMPGCQILAIKDGVVFYNKSFGYHTYAKKHRVSNNDIYDLASLTKILATTPAIMKLTEEGKINLYDKISTYIKGLDSTNKKNIQVKQLLAHQARLRAWIPFYLKTLNRKKLSLDTSIYRHHKDSVFSLAVTDNLYIRKSYTDTMYRQIIKSALRKRKGYRYSDLGFYLLYKIISENLQEDFPSYLENNFYAPLGSNTLCFNPLRKFSRDKIVPTERDKVFRKQLVQGYVHDYGAAMMGGVGGHAGLFSNANDLAKLMQMYLQKGEYGGQRFFKDKTVGLFTKQAYARSLNRRALGFDKPGQRKKSPVIRAASAKSYGHSGFTGTIAWVDPKYNFVYIFLSNRVHPDAGNRKLVKMNVRAKIQAVFYDAFLGV